MITIDVLQGSLAEDAFQYDVKNQNAVLVVFWVKLRQKGYTRSITGLYRVLRRQGEMAVKLPNPKYKT